MLELKEGKVILDPDLMTIPQFREIWERDTSSTKEAALAHISYIFNIANPKSPFYGYPESERPQQIINKLFPEALKTYKVYDDKAVLQALDLYKEMLNLSPLRNMLEAGKEALHQLSVELRSNKSKMATKLNNLGKMKRAMQDYKEAEELIMEDELKNARLRGERKVRKRER